MLIGCMRDGVHACMRDDGIQNGSRAHDWSNGNASAPLRLVALVVLQIHPLNGIFLPDHRDFTAQCQFSRTR
jgi:hypothetical protein